MHTHSQLHRDLYWLSTLLSVTYSSIKILPTHTHAHTNLPFSKTILCDSTKSIIQYSDPIDHKQECMLVVCFTWVHLNGGCTTLYISMQPSGNRDKTVVEEAPHSTDQTLIVRVLYFPSGVVLTLMKTAHRCQICSSTLTAGYCKRTLPSNHLQPPTTLKTFSFSLPFSENTKREICR